MRTHYQLDWKRFGDTNIGRFDGIEYTEQDEEVLVHIYVELKLEFDTNAWIVQKEFISLHSNDDINIETKYLKDITWE